MALLFFVLMDSMGLVVHKHSNVVFLFFLFFYMFALPLFIMQAKKIKGFHDCIASKPFVLGLLVSYMAVTASIVVFEDFELERSVKRFMSWWLAGALHNPILILVLHYEKNDCVEYSTAQTLLIFFVSICVCSLVLLDMEVVNPLFILLG